MQISSLLSTVFYGIKVVHLTRLAAMKIGFREGRWILILPTLQRLYFFSLAFPRLSPIFINIHEYANEMIFIKPMLSINLLYDITGSITKCHNNSLGLKLVDLSICNDFSVIFNVFIKIHEYAN